MTRPHLRSLAAILSLTTPAAVTLVACSLNRPQMYLASAGPVAAARTSRRGAGRTRHRELRPDRREPLPGGARQPGLDLLDRRRHRVLRQRAALPERRAPAAARRRAHRGAGQLLPLRLPAPPTARRRSPLAPKSRPCPWNARRTACCASGCARATCPTATQPARNLVFLVDVSGSMYVAEQAAAGQALARAAGQAAAASAIGSRSSCTPAPRGWCCASTAGSDTRRSSRRSRASRRAARPTAAQGIELAYEMARASVHPGRHQPRHPGDRRRLQRRRQQPGRAHAPDRRQARARRVPDRARLRHGQPQGLDDGEARRSRQRQLRLHRLVRRGAQGAGREIWPARWSPSPRT